MPPNFHVEKIQLISFTQLNNCGIASVKTDESMINEKPYFKMQILSFSSKLLWGSNVASIAKTAFKKIGALICSFNHVF